MKSLIASIQQGLSDCRFARAALLKVRNQIDCVFGYYLAKTCDSAANGEERLLQHLKPFLGLFFDVGANKGSWTELYLKKTKTKVRGYLFEPSRKNSSQLRKTFQKNLQIKVIPKAMGREPGQAFFFEDHGNDEHSRVSTLKTGLFKQVVCEISTVDLEMKRLKIKHISYLKVDTEGFDGYVIQGAQEALKFQKIDFIQFEYNTMWKEAGSTLTHIFNLLKEYGYETFLIQPNGICRYPLQCFGEVFRYGNFFSVRKGLHSKISGLILS